MVEISEFPDAETDTGGGETQVTDPKPSDEPPTTSNPTIGCGAASALRVSCAMRGYLPPPPPPAADATADGDRCKAMMEIVRKDHSKWTVSKLVLDHNHSVSEGPTGPSGKALAPEMGLEFDSVEAAKEFYYKYGELKGFKAWTGSNRRSAAGGALIMQRFLCWKGNYLLYKNNRSSDCVGTRKRKLRGPGRKTAPKLQVNEVVEVESLAEKAAVAEAGDQSGEVSSGPSVVNEVKPVEENRGKNGEDGEKDKESAVASTARLLRELGVKVYRYTNDERRDIVLKYMIKRSNRQGVERPVKIASRQAVAESHRRGIGGRFLSSDGQTSNGPGEMAEEESAIATENVANVGGEPKVGMVFVNEDRAYQFYVKYAGNVGFSVRKGWWDKTARSITRSRVYVCSREGFRPKIAVNETKKPRPETRTGCPARMAIKITSNGKYCVSEFVAYHNHQLAAPLDVQMLKSQRLIAKVQPEAYHNASPIPSDYKNYLRSKRTKDIRRGDAGALLEYLQKMKGDIPSFFYAIQVDENDQLTNIFWADPTSMMDYYYFGDVVCFDTTYKANDYGRPLALFIGVNHHKQAIIFGAALLYDESVESFKWLFDTFNAAMSGKQPKTLYTDQCAAIGYAMAAVWPGTDHRLCVWHIYHNASKHLSHVFQRSDTFSLDFSQCIYDFEVEEEFLSAWQIMLEKYELQDNEWLIKLYEERERWALAYGKQVFSADIQSTLRSENLTSVLKEHLCLEIDLSHFFKQYEKVVDERRYAEQQADYHATQGISGIVPLQLLSQAADAYTPTVFEVLRMEFESSMECIIHSRGEVGTVSEYAVTAKEKNKKHFVRLDSSDGSVICSCKKFEVVGVQCCHVLKVLDFRNVKELPPQYILKRWRKDAKAEFIRENHENMLDNNPKSALPKRYNSLCRMLYKIAARAAETEEAYAFMESQSDQLLEQVEQILQARLLEKTPMNAASKSQQQNLIEIESMHCDNNSESQGMIGRKKDGGARRRHQGGMEMNERQKGRKGQSGEVEVSLRCSEPLEASNENVSHPMNFTNQVFASNQLMQATYVTSDQFGLGSVQGYRGVTQFNPETSASVLQQRPFPGSSHLSQNVVQACPAPDMQPLQFVASNPHLGHQSGDQGHCTIPVWDFL